MKELGEIGHWLKTHRKPYLLKLVSKFGYIISKSVSPPLSAHHILSKAQFPKNTTDMLKMENILYICHD